MLHLRRRPLPNEHQAPVWNHYKAPLDKRHPTITWIHKGFRYVEQKEKNEWANVIYLYPRWCSAISTRQRSLCILCNSLMRWLIYKMWVRRRWKSPERSSFSHLFPSQSNLKLQSSTQQQLGMPKLNFEIINYSLKHRNWLRVAINVTLGFKSCTCDIADKTKNKIKHTKWLTSIDDTCDSNRSIKLFKTKLK